MSVEDGKVIPTNHEYELVESQIKSVSSRKAPDMTWSNLNFKVKDKYILKDCWGKAASGSCSAVMGPSGGGKSSLLNVLAGRSSSSMGITIEGTIEVNGKVIHPVSFRKNIAYVMQDDALLATATPREALEFSANMRLPSDISKETIKELVEKTINELGLQSCADVMIGGALIKGISGGQRKRTSVGVEMITSPSLLFLDEPTSGLDSYSAFSLITLLKKVAQVDGCTILCTIHQPSSEVFFLFDNVTFLKSGRVFFQGPVTDIIGKFSALGYECPSNYNPSDFIMNLCQTLSEEEIEKKGIFMGSPPTMNTEHVSVQLNDEIIFVTESSFVKQIFALTYREFTNTIRDVGALIGRFGVTIILNLLFGLIFMNAGGRDDGNDTDFNSHFGALTMITISSMFGAAQPIMLTFPFERPLFLREYSTGTYGALAYFIGKLIVEIPMGFITTLVAYILVYFLVDFQGSFILLVVASWALGMASASVAVLLGCLVADVKQVSELAPLLFVPQMLFVGFFVRTSQIPIFLRWAQYLCSLKYAMNLLILIEFNPSNDNCQSSPEAEDNCHNLIQTNDISEDQYYIYIILLFVLFAGFRLLAGFVLTEKAKKFY